MYRSNPPCTMATLVCECFLMVRFIFLFMFLHVAVAGAAGLIQAAPELPYSCDRVEAGDDPEALLDTCMVALYGFRFLKADSLSLQLLDNHPDNHLSHFARSHYYWWMMISLPPDNEAVAGFNNSIQRARELFDKKIAGEKNPGHSDLFYAISLSAMSARHDLMAGKYLRALNRGRNAYASIKHSLGQEETFDGLYLTSGLYHYMAEAAVSRYPFLRIYQLLFPAGDKKLGLSQLKKAADLDHPVWQTEATYFLMRIFLEMENDPEQALHYAETLTGRFPENLIYQYYQMLALKEAGKEQDALDRRQVFSNAAMMNEGLSDIQRKYFLELADELFHSPQQ